MWEGMALSTNKIAIYMPLLNEGVDVVRPVSGLVVRPNVVLVEVTADYDPEFETWLFPPGSEVRCNPEVWEGKQILVARERVLESAKST